MPVLLIFFGVLLLVSAYRHNTPALGAQFASDLAGFSKWAAAIVAIGLLQYLPGAAAAARGLMLLVAVVIFLKSGSGFFDQLKAGFDEFSTASAGTATEKAQVSQAATAAVSAEKQVSALAATSTGTVASAPGGGLVGGVLKAFGL